ncbi:hypothetical protein ACUTAH_22445 [Metapseudomonas furukawaii]|uniref:hypothetical protein n=1 Tax=Metapseudomonas furukawaii TaxID=1149133 RepID=UPI004045497D
MRSFYKSKLASVFIEFMKASPILVIASMGFRILFLMLQALSVWVIFTWISGGVNKRLAEFIDLPADSYVYLCVGAVAFCVSTLVSLLSRVCILRGARNFERILIDKGDLSLFSVTKGDLKNIIKLLVSVADAMVPAFILVVVSLAWVYITAYAAAFVAVLLVAGVWVLKRGAAFSAKRYKFESSKRGLEGYVDSEEHRGFYSALILPSYVFAVSIFVVSCSIVLTIVAAKYYLSSHEERVSHIAILTGVAILQIRSFSGIVLRAGAYSKSLTRVYDVVSSWNKK